MLGIDRQRRRAGNVWIAAILAACLASAVGGGSVVLRAASPAKAPAQLDQVTSLEESIQPLEQYFNQGREQTRFLALLSPT